MTEKINGRLENWHMLGNCICGNLYDDPDKRWKKGEYVRTSLVRDSIESLKPGDIVQTKNSRYLLGVIFKPNF